MPKLDSEMDRRNHYRQLVALVVAIVMLSGSAQAVSVVAMTFEELVDQSAAVVYARVADVDGRWTADRRGIESIVTLDALRYLKGDLGDRVAMRLPGGRAGGFVNVLPGAPVLQPGDLVVLFLGAKGPSIPFPLGLTQGVFRVTTDARGQALVSAPPLKASPAGKIVRGAADRRALTVEAFAAEVRAVAGDR